MCSCVCVCVCVCVGDKMKTTLQVDQVDSVGCEPRKRANGSAMVKKLYKLIKTIVLGASQEKEQMAVR